MTRNNLDEHLSWLLRAKPSLPPARSDLPEATATVSLPPASQRTVEAIGGFGPDAHIDVDEDTITGGGRDMARLRTAPSSAHKPRLVSAGPQPSPTARFNTITRAQDADREAESRLSSIPQTPTRRAPRAYTPQDDVEIMDMTEGLGQLCSPRDSAAARRGMPRKRKSDEFDEDTDIVPGSGRGDGRSNQQHYLPISKFASRTSEADPMDVPQVPPPPYSTVAPLIDRSQYLDQERNPQKTNARTTAPLQAEFHETDIPDSDDDNLFDFAGDNDGSSKSRIGSPPKKKRAVTIEEATIVPTFLHADYSSKSVRKESKSPLEYDSKSVSKPDLPSSGQHATQGDQRSEESGRLQKFFSMSGEAINTILRDIAAREEEASNHVAFLMDEGDDEAAEKMSMKLDDLDALNHAVGSLWQKRSEHQRLTSKRTELFDNLRAAIRKRDQSVTNQAKAANNAAKAELQRFEAECMSLLQICEDDVNKVLDSIQRADVSNPATIQATQIQHPGIKALGAAAPSSSRIAQTQSYDSEAFNQARGIQSRPTMNVNRGYSGVHAGGNMDPPAKASCTSHHHNAPKAFSFDRPETPMIHPDDVPDENEDIFTNRMGTPPAFGEVDEEEFSGGEDDMLDFVNNVENQGIQTVTRGPTRKVFAETTGNKMPASKKLPPAKPKSTMVTHDDPQFAKLFSHPWSNDVKRTLKQQFKLQGFRENQLEAINATLAGEDAFVLMPTGGGKSLCYQLPSQIRTGRTRGVTIVISPLLSLMEDQVQHMRKLNIQALLINGSTTQDDRRAILDNLRRHDVEDFIQILYVTPEMLSKSTAITSAFDYLYSQQRLARLVIDEAHCVSQWGHDFRPDYKLIGDVRKKYPNVPVMALTATATENVKVDTVHNLGIKGCKVFTRSFNRPNLYYEVRAKSSGKNDIVNIAKLINEKHRGQTGIIYCLSRKNCESMADDLRLSHGIQAHYYHAGLTADQKSDIQRAWQSGKYPVIVATIAFGMGIDKPNVRFVIHHSLPKSLEGYYQETGRAGRDGADSSCYLFFGYPDVGKLRRMIDENKDVNWQQKERQHEMLRKMAQYCHNRADCRRVQVLGYFNEAFRRDDCDGGCDNCKSGYDFESRDVTELAKRAIGVVRALQNRSVTLLYCMDVFRGVSKAAVTKNGDQHLEDFGKGSGLDRDDAERLFYALLAENVFKEVQVLNKAGFPTQYVNLGPRCDDISPSKRQFALSMRLSPRGKKQDVSFVGKRQESAAQKKVKKQAGSKRKVADLPLSTNVSSPVQAAPRRKGKSASTRQVIDLDDDVHDEFGVADEEFDGLGEDEETESDDAYEPQPSASPITRKQSSRPASRAITSDEVLDSLNDVHRAVVDDFVYRGKELGREIMSKNEFRTPPFTDTILREMAINFTETPEEMLRIKGIDAGRVERFGKRFGRLVREVQKNYNDMMAQTTDRRPADPNATVIDLLSDDSEDDDEYGSFDGSGLEDEPGEASSYFRSTGEVAAFNDRFAHSQSAAMRTKPVGTAATKASGKPRQRNYRATGSGSYGGGGGGGTRQWRGSGMRSQWSRSTSNNAAKRSTGITKKTSTRKTGGGSMKRNTAGNGYISMMPT